MKIWLTMLGYVTAAVNVVTTTLPIRISLIIHQLKTVKKHNYGDLNRRATAKVTVTVKPLRLDPSYIDKNLLQQSLKLKTNNFLEFIKSVYNEDAVAYVKQLYKIGTSSKWSGAVIFWQIDQHNKIRTGKIMRYNSITGKKLAVNWVHSVFNIKRL